MSKKSGALFKAIKAARSEGVRIGFMAFAYLLLLVMYNVNTEKKYLSRPKFKQFFLEIEAEFNRLFTEEHRNDPDSVAEVAMYHNDELRRKILDE